MAVLNYTVGASEMMSTSNYISIGDNNQVHFSNHLNIYNREHSGSGTCKRVNNEHEGQWSKILDRYVDRRTSALRSCSYELHLLRSSCSIKRRPERNSLRPFQFRRTDRDQTKKQRSPEQPAPYAALRATASFRITVISIIFSSLPPLGVMNIAYSRVFSSLILVTLRQTEGPLMGSS